MAIDDPCPGSGELPSKVTRVYKWENDRPYRGLCAACNRSFKLSYSGKVFKHRRPEDLKFPEVNWEKPSHAH